MEDKNEQRGCLAAVIIALILVIIEVRDCRQIDRARRERQNKIEQLNKYPKQMNENTDDREQFDWYSEEPSEQQADTEPLEFYDFG